MKNGDMQDGLQKGGGLPWRRGKTVWRAADAEMQVQGAHDKTTYC